MAAPNPPAVTAPARPEHRGPVLVALMVTMALSAMDNNIVSTAIPQVVRDLGGFSLFSWVFSSYLLTQTVTIPVYGKLADLWGRKPILITGTLIFLAGSALCASAWSMVRLICFRGLQGLGAGSIMATVNTLTGDLYDLEERGRVQGWLSSVWGVRACGGCRRCRADRGRLAGPVRVLALDLRDQPPARGGRGRPHRPVPA
jgi:MFS family permease